ncbi:MAG: pentapeptide repeat-containing protein [Cyanobacteria bacterium K_Offshore_0m_m2_072]|nr:pentapeptide repeat-containing protein [Cyanobacteria bacterium K_Offshore_0m_m2_072]
MGTIKRATALIGTRFGILATMAALACTGPGQAANANELLRLLEQRRCPGCRLQDADLVHADLRDADLRQAQLQRANLSRARLDGANLQGADLRFISLQGASLRGANLKGAMLEGADLRQADLSGARLDAGSLASTHWDQAVGIDKAQMMSYAELHNAGVNAANQNRYPEAERFFSDAIRKQPLAAVSWMARAICRSEQGKLTLAASDFGYAAKLYEQAGEVQLAAELKRTSEQLQEPAKGPKGGGNGKGMEAVGGAVAAFKVLAPIAVKAFMPLPF